MLTINQCQKCGHRWLPRSENKSPSCPRCRTTKWDNYTPSVYGFENIKPGESRFYRLTEMGFFEGWEKVWDREWANAKRRKGMDLFNSGGVGGVLICNGKQ